MVMSPWLSSMPLTAVTTPRAGGSALFMNSQFSDLSY